MHELGRVARTVLRQRLDERIAEGAPAFVGGVAVLLLVVARREIVVLGGTAQDAAPVTRVFSVR